MKTRRRGRRIAVTTGLCVLLIGLAVIVWYREEIRASYALWVNFERLPDNERGYAEYRHRATGMLFVPLRAQFDSMVVIRVLDVFQEFVNDRDHIPDTILVISVSLRFDEIEDQVKSCVHVPLDTRTTWKQDLLHRLEIRRVFANRDSIPTMLQLHIGWE